MIDNETAMRLVAAAYSAGWGDACDDHIKQQGDPEHAIGESLRTAKTLVQHLDPNNLLGLR